MEQNQKEKPTVAPDSGNKVLDATQLADALIDLPGWELKGKQIVKLYTFKTFDLAMEFVNKIAELATKHNHHPDVHISYNKVKVLCWTHKFNAVTKLDTAFAAEVEKVFESI